MEVEVSVLVAVYNAERYLSACLDSLLVQTLKNIQVICVDDCSTDSSLQLLNDYAARDSRIEVYRMAENSGQAKARNEALRHVRGRYVAFLDSDDWMAPDALEQCVAVFRSYPKTGCVLLRVLTVDEQGCQKDYDKPIPSVMTGNDAFIASLDWTIHGLYVAWRELYEKWPYDDTCRTYSDDNTTRQHYFHSREVRYAPAAVYYYRSHPYSVTKKASVRQFDRLQANESMKRQLFELQVSPDVLAFYEYQRWLVLVDCYMFYYVHGCELMPEERQYGLSEMRRVWNTIDRSMLDKKTTAKFGYRPCRWWWLFRLQELLYFTLRGFLGKNY